MPIEGGITPFQEKVLAWLYDKEELIQVSAFQISPCRGLHNRGYLSLLRRRQKWFVRISPEGRALVEERNLLERIHGKKKT